MADLHYTAVYEPDDELEQKPAGWDHVAGRTQPVPGEEALPEGVERVADGYLVEIDADPEPRRSRGNDSSDVEEEIQRLRAEKEASDQRANAAAAVVTLKDHKTTLERSFQEAEEYRRQAQAQYADAANSFDHDRAVAALAQVTAAERHKEECDRAYREIEAQEAEAQQRLAQTQQQTVSDPVEAWIAANNLLPADAKYLRERKGFINEHRDNADLLLSAAKLAEKRYGLQPGTAEYHEFLDREAGVADAGNVQPSQPRQTRKSGGSTKRYSAPASRSSGRAPQSRTFLTEFEPGPSSAIRNELPRLCRDQKQGEQTRRPIDAGRGWRSITLQGHFSRFVLIHSRGGSETLAPKIIAAETRGGDRTHD
jgi:hypothetical protein